MPPSHPLSFMVWSPEMSMLLKSNAVDLPEIKNQQGRKFDKPCRVRIGCAYVKKAKNKKINGEKGGNKQKKQDS